MANEETIRAAKLRARSAARKALGDLGQAWKTYIKESVSVRVQRGRRGGWIRSDPDEPPRRDIPGSGIDPGRLYRSFHYRVKREATPTIESLICWTNDPKSVWLEHGTDYIEPRPFWEPARQELLKYYRIQFRQRTAAYMKEMDQNAAFADFPADDEALNEEL